MPKSDISRPGIQKDYSTTKIVWDFDGTILPIEPYDSEQNLLLYSIRNADINDRDISHRENKGFQRRMPTRNPTRNPRRNPARGSTRNPTKSPMGRLIRRLFTKLIIFADNKNLLGPHFKPIYLSVLKGSPSEAVTKVTRMLAEKISSEDRETFGKLYRRGIEMLVVSCGTRDLSHGTLEAANILQFFKAIIANDFTHENGRITGMVFRTKTAEDKLAVVKEMGYRPENTIVVGDGPTDIPLLEWSEYPVIIRRNKRINESSPAWFTQKPRKRYRSISKISEILEIVDEIHER